MRIRRAVEGDVTAMRAVMARAYDLDSVRLGYCPIQAREKPEAWVAQHSAWVGETDSQVMAVLLARPEAGVFHVRCAAVDPAWQGEGFGRVLIDEAEALAREAGLAEVRLSANVILAETIAHYEHCGYEVRARVPHPEKGGHAMAELAKAV